MPKISALPAAGSVSGSDLIALVSDPGGTPVTSKAAISQIVDLVPDPAWDDITDKPATFAPAAHTHAGVYEPADAAIQSHLAAAHAPSNAQKNSDITKAEIEAKLTGEISSHSHAGGGGEAFPVGSVFIAVVSTNPGTLLGYGTWSAFAAGRMLVGLDAGQTEFDTVEETGGAKTHTLTEAEMPSHTHLQNAHTHGFFPRTATTGSVSSIVTGTLDTSSTIGGTNQPHIGLTTAVNQATGGDAAHNNLPPYVVVHMWKRTA